MQKTSGWTMVVVLAMGLGCDDRQLTPGDAGGDAPSGHELGPPEPDRGAVLDGPGLDRGSADLATISDVSSDLPANTGNQSCTSPQPLLLSGGKVTVKASTKGGANEFPGKIDCGNYKGPFDGPQVYYSLAVTAGTSYKLVLTPDFAAQLYVFSGSAGCASSAVNQYCSSGGATGTHLAIGDHGQPPTGSLFFSPASPGTYLIAVDGRSTSDTGSFTLTVEEYTPAGNDTCAKAEAITLSAGHAFVSGSTHGLEDEFPNLTCAPSGKLNAPQAYYKVALSAGKAYALRLTSGFESYLYVFSSAAGCTQSGIAADCSSKGATGGRWSMEWSGYPVYFTPTKAGTYYLAVDSDVDNTEYYEGDFTLDIQEFSPPSNATCANAAPIVLVGGKATVKGSTAGANDEFPTLKCGLYELPHAGAQVYYSLPMSQDKVYTFNLNGAGFLAELYLFRQDAGCDPAAMAADCSSQGLTGDMWDNPNEIRGFFVPSGSGTYIIAIDAPTTDLAGAFTLQVEESSPPSNASCAKPAPFTVVPGKTTTLTGNTAGAKNEFSIKCGIPAVGSFAGPQLYFQGDLKAGTSYSIGVDIGFEAYLYAFLSSVGCSQTAINTACASGGQSGKIWGMYFPGTHGSATFTPTASGLYTFVVDSFWATEFGPVTITIQ